MIPENSIICGDCLEVMKEWPDNCVDLVLTDPPYGKRLLSKNGYVVGKPNERCLAKRKFYGVQQWDNEIPQKETFQRMFDIGKEQIIFGGNYMVEHLPARSCWIVWDKDNIASPFADCELAWTSFSAGAKIVKWRWNGMLQEPNYAKEIRQHPTQKPLGVMRWILERYSKPNDLILDPFCGSGTTCVAAKMLGRRYIGIDISEKYCEIARQRLEAVDTGVPVREQNIGQQPLFPVDK